MYPRATMPVTTAVLRLANARADRWRKRYDGANARADAAEAVVERVRKTLADAPALMLDGGYIDVFVTTDALREALGDA